MQPQSIASRLANLPAEVRKAALAELSEEEAEEVFSDWRFWARPEQLAPKGDWEGWMILAGRGFGKTRVGAEHVALWARTGRFWRIGLVGETAADTRKVMIEGESGLLNVGPVGFRPRYEPSNRQLIWPNGAIATTYNGLEPDQLRGPQHDLIWFDELAKMRYAQDAFDQAMFGLRLGEDPRWIATTTPRPIPVIKDLLRREGKGVVVTRGRTADNLVNIAPTFRKNVVDRYIGTRLGRQELDAEILDDAPGALWSRRGLDDYRVRKAPPLKRIVVAVDPAVTSGENANETGIIACGLGEDGHGYVLDDGSGVYQPDEMGRRVVAMYRKWDADKVVIEVNNGGELFRPILRAVAANLPMQEVRASRGKFVRAEPISAIYEQGRVHHVGTFAALEDQMTVFTADRSDMEDRGYDSPDRVDALVWGMTSLFPQIAESSRQDQGYRQHGAIAVGTGEVDF